MPGFSVDGHIYGLAGSKLGPLAHLHRCAYDLSQCAGSFVLLELS